jgi:hypothetical protein
LERLILLKIIAMENTTNETNELNNNEKDGVEQPTIFSDIAVDTTAYEKNITNARVWLYVIGGLQILYGAYEYFKYSDYSDAARWMIFGVEAGLGLIFISLAVLSYKKPFIAFLTALIIYILVNVWVTYMTGLSAASFGWIIKIFVIIALIRGIKDAREYAAINKDLIE